MAAMAAMVVDSARQRRFYGFLSPCPAGFGRRLQRFDVGQPSGEVGQGMVARHVDLQGRYRRRAGLHRMKIGAGAGIGGVAYRPDAIYAMRGRRWRGYIG